MGLGIEYGKLNFMYVSILKLIFYQDSFGISVKCVHTVVSFVCSALHVHSVHNSSSLHDPYTK